MTPFATLSGAAAALAQANIDTDQIIPARFLRRPREDGYNNFLFHDLRAGSNRFPLGATGNPPIIVADANFGCGSSREGAVYALVDSGVRCVIASSFGDIFAGNAAKNGLLTVVLSPEECAALRDAAVSGAALTVDLQAQEVRVGEAVHPFSVDPFRKRCLLAGLDDIDLTLENAAEIEAFEANIPWLRPWALPS